LLSREIEGNCTPGADGAALLAQAMARLSLSARAYHRILKVARTIADMAASDAVSATAWRRRRLPPFRPDRRRWKRIARIQCRNIASHNSLAHESDIQM
jgi:hypothetical protein